MSEEIQLFGINFWHGCQISFLRVGTIFLRKTYTFKNLYRINVFRSFWWTSLNSVPKIFGAGYQKFFLLFFIFGYWWKKFLLLAKILRQFIQNSILRVRRIIWSKFFGLKKNFNHFPTISTKSFWWTVLGRNFKTRLSTAKRLFWGKNCFCRCFISIISKPWAENYRLSDIYFTARVSKGLSTCPMERKDFVWKN